jgi:hypothetical protein
MISTTFAGVVFATPHKTSGNFEASENYTKFKETAEKLCRNFELPEGRGGF